MDVSRKVSCVPPDEGRTGRVLLKCGVEAGWDGCEYFPLVSGVVVSDDRVDTRERDRVDSYLSRHSWAVGMAEPRGLWRAPNSESEMIICVIAVAVYCCCYRILRLLCYKVIIVS